MKKILLFFVVVLAISCNTTTEKQVEIISEGYFKCFEENLKQENGKPFTCEPSTVVYHDGEIFVANDKVFPDSKSSFFSFSFDEKIVCKSKKFYQNPLFYLVNKYESSTITPDNKFILFSSSYSYPSTDSIHGEKYNTTIFMNADDISKGGILHFGNDTNMNSIDVKNQLKSALRSSKYPNGPDYMKIEGLTAIPGNKLLFGVREVGDKYEDFEYTITLLAVDYEVVDDKIQLIGNAYKFYEFTPSDSLGISLPVGLSSIEYNPFDKNIYLVTSFELGEDTKSRGAYLWHLSIEELNTGQAPHLIYNLDKNHTIFKSDHKIEGLTVIDENTLLLIADDDRITGKNEENSLFTRKLNQAYWCLVRVGDFKKKSN